MKPISLQQSRQIVGGKALSAIPAAVPDITAICTDTRHIEAGSLFVALRGESHDAHDYLPQAAAGGAIAALVTDAHGRIAAQPLPHSSPRHPQSPG